MVFERSLWCVFVLEPFFSLPCMSVFVSQKQREKEKRKINPKDKTNG